MYKQDYILLIMNCEKYRFKAQKQKETWLKDLPDFLIYYHVIGNPLLDKEYIFDDNERILYVKTNDDYNSLPKKVIKSFEIITKVFDYKYIFKTDDDQILNNYKFFDMVKGLIQSKNYDYGGNVVDVKQSYLSQYYRIHPELPSYLPVNSTKYCSGRFYFLSKDIVNDLLKTEKKELIENEYLEDYAIGFHMNARFKNKENILHIPTDSFFRDM